MARGKKYPDDIKEKAYLAYATCGNINEVARQLGVPYATVAGWIDKKKGSEPDEFEALRQEKKKDFIERSSDVIDKAMSLLDRRFTRALEKEYELDMLIDEIFKPEEISQKEKEKLVQKIRALQLQDVRAITTAVGTLYDKRALAKGESTENTAITIKLPNGMNEYAE